MGIEGVSAPPFTPIEKVLKFFVGFNAMVESCEKTGTEKTTNSNCTSNCFETIFCI
jgi:hypothetical protein